MKNVKARFYKPNDGSVSKIAYKFYATDEVNIDDIVVVDSKFGLGFAVITEILNEPVDTSLHKVLCVVPPQGEVIY